MDTFCFKGSSSDQVAIAFAVVTTSFVYKDGVGIISDEQEEHFYTEFGNIRAN